MAGKMRFLAMLALAAVVVAAVSPAEAQLGFNLFGGSNDFGNVLDSIERNSRFLYVWTMQSILNTNWCCGGNNQGGLFGCRADNNDPVIECPNQITVDGANPVVPQIQVRDNECAVISTSYNPPANNQVNVGTTQYTFTATDSNNNQATCQFNVVNNGQCGGNAFTACSTDLDNAQWSAAIGGNNGRSPQISVSNPPANTRSYTVACSLNGQERWSIADAQMPLAADSSARLFASNDAANVETQASPTQSGNNAPYHAPAAGDNFSCQICARSEAALFRNTKAILFAAFSVVRGNNAPLGCTTIQGTVQ